MMFKKSAGTATLECAETHADAKELSILLRDGPFLVFDFGPEVTFESARESLKTMDVFIGGLISDTDEPDEIAALSQLKVFVSSIERDVSREFAHISNDAVNTEATGDYETSRLHADQNTSSSVSSSSNEADAVNSNNEELTQDGETKQQQETSDSKPRRKRKQG